MSLKIYNTLSNQVEPFESLVEGKVSMYVCGPTVYDFLHIGNFRGAVFFNMMRHWLEKLGYEVTFIYNYTDVDDKIINRANEQGVSPEELSQKYIVEFEKDFKSLKLDPHTQNPRATEFIDSMVNVIEKLVEKERAYVVDGEVFYSIDSFKNYGKLSGKKLDELEAGSRVEVDKRKKNPFDFVLWKPSKEGEPAWDSPWGKGRPGWHIECSTMILSLLGDQIDIHGGGIDLTFPHHENEIAQAEGVTDHPFVKYWVHHNFIKFDDEKMSKSLGNVIKARDFIEKYDAEILKFMFLSVHYRSMINMAESQIQQAISSLSRIYEALSLAETMIEKGSGEGVEDVEFKKATEEHSEKMKKALNDDFNTSVVFASIYEVIRLFNGNYKLGQKIKPDHVYRAKVFKEWLGEWGELLSLFSEEPKHFLTKLDNILLEERSIQRNDVDSLVSDRSEARKNKDFDLADKIRGKLDEIGIEILDTPEGTRWTVKKGFEND